MQGWTIKTLSKTSRPALHSNLTKATWLEKPVSFKGVLSHLEYTKYFCKARFLFSCNLCKTHTEGMNFSSLIYYSYTDGILYLSRHQPVLNLKYKYS